jgi:hypothetical protein
MGTLWRPDSRTEVAEKSVRSNALNRTVMDDRSGSTIAGRRLLNV